MTSVYHKPEDVIKHLDAMDLEERGEYRMQKNSSDKYISFSLKKGKDETTIYFRNKFGPVSYTFRSVERLRETLRCWITTKY
jgi:hypothetical protein